MTKKCKQCGVEKDIADFRPYVSRNTGLRQSTTGHNTVCRSCEAINVKAARLFKKGSKATPQEARWLADAASAYKALGDAGLQPVGSYARYVLYGETEARPFMGRATSPDKSGIEGMLVGIKGAAAAPDVPPLAQGGVVTEHYIASPYLAGPDVAAHLHPLHLIRDSCMEHIYKLEARSYDSVAAATAEHDRLRDVLRQEGLYEQADSLLEDWELEVEG